MIGAFKRRTAQWIVGATAVDQILIQNPDIGQQLVRTIHNYLQTLLNLETQLKQLHASAQTVFYDQKGNQIRTAADLYDCILSSNRYNYHENGEFVLRE